MALTPFDLLTSVVTALLSAHRGALYRLAVHHARTGLRVPPQANPKAFAEGTVDPLPGTIDAPFSEVVIDGGPSRKVVGQESPLAAALQEVEDGLEDLAQIADPWASVSFGHGKVGLYVVPFGVG
jgi:hypothetical protein